MFALTKTCKVTGLLDKVIGPWSLVIGRAAARLEEKTPNDQCLMTSDKTTFPPVPSVQREESQLRQLSFSSLSGAYSEGVIPSSIPNLEVKPLSADNTAPFGCGKVGRCRAGGFFTTILSAFNPKFLIYCFFFTVSKSLCYWLLVYWLLEGFFYRAAQRLLNAPIYQ